MIEPFTILARIGDGANHIMTSEELILTAKEASFAPCTIIAGVRDGEYEDQIEIVIRYKHQRGSQL